MFTLSPWQAAGLWNVGIVASPFALLPFSGPLGLPLATYYSAVTAGSWFATGQYIPGWANRFFAPFASFVPQSSYIPSGPVESGRAYVRKALSGEMVNGRLAKANDAFSTYARAKIVERDGPNADEREKTLCEIADSTTKWMDNAQRRADFRTAYQQASGNQRALLLLANLLRPGSKDLSDKDLASYAGSMLSFGEKSEKMTPEDVLQALLFKLGGASVVEAMSQEVAARC